jgi:hypothetical protein
MLLRVMRGRVIVLLVAALAIIAIFASFSFIMNGLESHSAQAQDRPTNMQTYLQQLKHRFETEKEFSFAFLFAEPLAGSSDYIWVIGPPGADEYQRYITQVGEDYVCFNELRGQARFEICTPFMNIVSVSNIIN